MRLARSTSLRAERSKPYSRAHAWVASLSLAMTMWSALRNVGIQQERLILSEVEG
jgi:hypothetical protein